MYGFMFTAHTPLFSVLICDHNIGLLYFFLMFSHSTSLPRILSYTIISRLYLPHELVSEYVTTIDFAHTCAKSRC